MAVSFISSFKPFKSLAVKLAIYMLIVVALDFTIGAFIANIYFKLDRGSSGATINRILETKTDILILGSSTAYHNYKPSILENALHMTVYNAGDDGKSILHFYGVLTMLGKKHIPKLVIWDITNYDFSYPPTSYRTKDLLPYNRDDNVRTLLFDVDATNRIALLSRIYPYNGKIANVLTSSVTSDKNVVDNLKGYKPLYGSVDFSQMSFSGTAYQEIMDEAERSKTDKKTRVTQKYFYKFIEYTQSNNIRLICVYSPKAPVTKDYQTKILLEPEIVSELKRLGVPLIIVTAESNSNLNKLSSYRDIGHLNDEGAGYFSEYVALQIMNVIK